MMTRKTGLCEKQHPMYVYEEGTPGVFRSGDLGGRLPQFILLDPSHSCQQYARNLHTFPCLSVRMVGFTSQNCP